MNRDKWQVYSQINLRIPVTERELIQSEKERFGIKTDSDYIRFCIDKMRFTTKEEKEVPQ